MAVSHLERKLNLTIELALESLKSVEPSMKDKEKAGQIETAQRASDKKFMKRYHRGRLGHFNLYCFEWLVNTSEGRVYAQENPNPRRSRTSGSAGRRSGAVELDAPEQVRRIRKK